jgi:hypothetical protein
MVYITTSPSRASGKSSMTNGHAACFTSTTKKQKVYTNVQEGIFVFQVTRPRLMPIRRLQDLYEYHQRGTDNLGFGGIGDAYSLMSSFGSHPTTNQVTSNLSDDKQQQQLQQPTNQQQQKSSWLNLNLQQIQYGDDDIDTDEDDTTLGTPVFKIDELISVDMIVMTRRVCRLLELKSFCSSNCSPMKSYNNASIIDISSTVVSRQNPTTPTNHNNSKNECDSADIDNQWIGGQTLGGLQLKNDDEHFHPSSDEEGECVDESDEKTIAPDLESVSTAATRMSQPLTTAAFARLSDHSGWITIEVNGEDYVDQVTVEAGLFTFYVDNFSSGGVTARRHPMDDSSLPLATENCIQDIIHFQPMTQIYCDYKVVHPITGVEFYRIQRSNASYFPLWVHNIQYSNDKQRFPDSYKLLPISKYKIGNFAYRALQDTVLRSIPDCSEKSKVHSVKAIIRTNDVVVADFIRESPVPAFGNGPFMRLNSYGWLFEKKLHEAIFEPIPIQMGHWEFIVSSSQSFDMSSSSDNVTEGSSSVKDKECIFAFTQPLGRSFLRDGYTAKFVVDDIIQCDRKIVVNGSATANYELYRVILNDTESGWIMNNFDKVVRENDVKSNSTNTAVLQLLSCDEINYVKKSIDPPTEDDDNNALLFHSDDDDDDDSDAEDEWTPALVRGIASACGCNLTEIGYQPVGNVLKFETSDMILIHVFCSTRTVQTAFEDFVDVESSAITSSSRHGYCSNMMYQCYRNCSVRQLTKLLQITIVTMMSKTVFTMNSQDESTDGDDDQKENTTRQRYFDGDWDDIEDEKKDEAEGILDLTLENVLSRNTALLDALAIRASSRKSNNTKKHRKKNTTRLFFRESKEQEFVARNVAREKKVRDELLRCDMDILKLFAKRQQLWEAAQQFDEQRVVQSQQHSKIRLYQMN